MSTLPSIIIAHLKVPFSALTVVLFRECQNLNVQFIISTQIMSYLCWNTITMIMSNMAAY